MPVNDVVNASSGATASAQPRAVAQRSMTDELLGMFGVENGSQVLARVAATLAAGQSSSQTPPATAPLPRRSAARDALRAELDATIASRDAGRVQDLMTIRGDAILALAGDDEKLAMLEILCAGGWSHAPVRRLWDSFGSDRIVQVAAKHAALWNGCVERGAALHEIDAVKGVRAAFRGDVLTIAGRHMASNLRSTERELAALGIAVPGTDARPGAADGRDRRQAEIERLAVRAREIARAMTLLELTLVGSTRVRDLDLQTHVRGARFVPGTPPPTGPSAEELRDGTARRHDDVQAEWDKRRAELLDVASRSPAVYVALKLDRLDDIGGAPGGDRARAAAAVADVLRRLHANIVATRARLDRGGIDPLALAPVHEALFDGTEQGASGVPWTSPFARSVARGVVDDHDAWRMWLQLAAGIVGGALFIVADLFSGGLAGVALAAGGVAVSGGVAIESWSHYVDLARPAHAAADARGELVAPRQASDAASEALLNTVFAAGDVLAPAARLGRSAWQGLRSGRFIAGRAAVTQWARVAALTGEAAVLEAGPVIERIVVEHGVQRAIGLTGRTAEQLAELVPAGSKVRARLQAATSLAIEGPAATPEALVAARGARDARLRQLAGAAPGIREETAIAWLSANTLENRLGHLVGALDAKIIDGAIADRLVLEAIERYGPQRTLELTGGWKRLADALTNESAAAEPLLAWRKLVFDDLVAFAERELKIEIPLQGGSVGEFKNDLDFSLQGPFSTAQRARLSQHLARRLGVADDAATFNRLMMLELFTDPVRLIAYDALPLALRENISAQQAAFARDLIPNRDLHAAISHGDPSMIARVRGQLQALGVKEFAYRPLKEWEIRVLGRRLDVAHQALLDAHAVHDVAEVSRAAEELAYTQALIEAAGDGGYFTGANARRFVVNRKRSELKTIVGAPKIAGTSYERYAGLLDELSKLNHAAQELEEANLAQDLAGAMRAIGKYGDRGADVAATSPAIMATVGQPQKWKWIAEDCQELKRLADGKLTLEQLRVAPDVTVRNAHMLLDEVRESVVAALVELQGEVGVFSIAGASEAMVREIQATAKMLEAIRVAREAVGIAGRTAYTFGRAAGRQVGP